MPYISSRNKDSNINANKAKSGLFFPECYTIIDLETTGLSPNQNEIIEFAGIKVFHGDITDTFSTLIKPQYRINSFITELTGITNEMVSDAPDISMVLSEILNFIGEDIIVGHNVSFDVNFLIANCLSVQNRTLTNSYLDTMRISRKLYPELKHHRLKDIVNFLNIECGTYHRALNDCEMTYKCFEAMRKESKTNL